MKLTPRDRNLAMFMPAIVVCAIAAYLCASKYAEWNRAENALARSRLAAKPASIDPQVAEMRNKLSAATSKLSDAESRARGLEDIAAEIEIAMGELQQNIEIQQARWGDLTTFTRAPELRNDRIKRLNAILVRHGISLVKETDGDAGREIQLSESMRVLAQRIGQGDDGQNPQVRRIQFQGEFLNVHRALRELSVGELMAIPVGLTLKASPNSDRREWTLLVWI